MWFNVVRAGGIFQAVFAFLETGIKGDKKGKSLQNSEVNFLLSKFSVPNPQICWSRSVPIDHFQKEIAIRILRLNSAFISFYMALWCNKTV
jgi:hypothetical protein